MDRALGQVAAAGRFAETDLPAILAHQATSNGGPTSRHGEQHTLSQGATGWARLGTTGTGSDAVCDAHLHDNHLEDDLHDPDEGDEGREGDEGVVEVTS